MLPGATVPRSLANLLAVFRPGFTAPTMPDGHTTGLRRPRGHRPGLPPDREKAASRRRRLTA